MSENLKILKILTNDDGVSYIYGYLDIFSIINNYHHYDGKCYSI